MGKYASGRIRYGCSGVHDANDDTGLGKLREGTCKCAARRGEVCRHSFSSLFLAKIPGVRNKGLVRLREGDVY